MKRTYEQFLELSVGFGLGLFFVHLFRFSIFVFFCFSTTSNRLAGKNVSEMTYFVWSGT